MLSETDKEKTIVGTHLTEDLMIAKRRIKHKRRAAHCTGFDKRKRTVDKGVSRLG